MNEIKQTILGRCFLVSQILQFWRCPSSINITIFRHLKLEISLLFQHKKIKIEIKQFCRTYVNTLPSKVLLFSAKMLHYSFNQEQTIKQCIKLLCSFITFILFTCRI